VYKRQDASAAFSHFELLQEILQDAGFLQYEVSNFARNGAYSLHNKGYWDGEAYLGLGPSAHSFDGEKRSWNVAGIQSYIDGVAAGDATEGDEVLRPTDRVNEYLMTSLRTMWGCGYQKLKGLGGEAFFKETTQNMQPYISRGWVIPGEDAWVLSPEGLFHADGIASALFIVGE
jgi:oxygen-independent coproporphyrinogen-3 oxidase